MLCYYSVCVRPAGLHLPNQLPCRPLPLSSLWVRHLTAHVHLHFLLTRHYSLNLTRSNHGVVSLALQVQFTEITKKKGECSIIDY